MKQPWAWVSWLIAILVLLSITRNPLYLVLILLCVLFVGVSLRKTGVGLPGTLPLWKLAGWIILLATLFNALTSHYGTTILFTIPGKLPLVSGAVTLEAIVYGATNGLVLTGMLASFTVLNLALPVRELISLIPRAFFPMAVVTSIAVTYLPTTLRQFRKIREAQLIRGHQMRSLGDWLPLLMPLLVGGLEHAMQLAEAMTARGFASAKPAPSRRQIYPRFFMFLGLIVVALGWILQLSNSGLSGIILIVTGSVFILGGIWAIGRLSPRTTYHRSQWIWKDWLTLTIAVVVLLACIVQLTNGNSQMLSFEPYPTISIPLFSPLIGLVMLGLLVPGLLIMDQRAE